ncbi:MAG: Rpn family recombination-promoting nuclease/putative transposase [Chitinispirillales bacterium]|nr:Rpn family recombination-promoting nuclease/putative transposase [Chitinispirillales bacterium]
MERTIISFDYAIKNILRDKANFDVLSGFLTELLEREVTVQEILESESNVSNIDLKVNRLDLKAKIDNGELAVFEIQFFDRIDFLGKVSFNACKAVVEQVSSGDLYDIKKVYSINIAYFDLGAKREYVFRANLSKFSGAHFSDEYIPFSQSLNPPSNSGNLHPEYYLILSNKFDERMRNKFDEWVYTLKTSSVRSEFTAAGIQAAGEKLDVLKMTPQQRTEYERLRSENMDKKSQFYTAELKGKKEGLAEGKTEIAGKMKQRGVSDKEISEITGLSVEEIEKL